MRKGHWEVSLTKLVTSGAMTKDDAIDGTTVMIVAMIMMDG